MVAKENPIYLAALQFCKDERQELPETVIYGYSKLLSMEEQQVKAFVPEDSMKDLDLAYKWFSDNKLDLILVKSGLLTLAAVLPSEDRRVEIEKFSEYMDLEDKKTSSADILDKCSEISPIPIVELFKDGKTLDDIFAYREILYKEREKKAKDKKKKEKPETAEKPEEKKEEKAKKEEAVIEKRQLSDLSKKYRDLTVALLDVVKGQDQAVMKFIRGYNQGELLKQTEKGHHPRTYFFFFGPPGVGKTLLAETAAENLGIPHRTYNMSEYATHQSHEDLIGISRIYSNAKEGTLVQFVRENPECLLIFDEIEKAHINVIRQFLQILGAGKLHNIYRDEDTDFKDTTVIFTSNVGKDLYEDKSVNLTTLPEKVLIDAIQREKNPNGEPALPPEICSRIASGNTVMFNHLSVQHLAGMVRDNFDRIVTGMEAEYGVHISYAPELPLLFLYNMGGGIDARVATRQSRQFLKNEIFELMRQLENRKPERDVTDIRIGIEWDGMDSELKRLFKNNDKSEVMVFSDNYALFRSIDNEKYMISRVSTLEEAKDAMKRDISAVYIDPFFGTGKEDETILSISDYNTEGVKLFHDLMEARTDLPIFLLEMDRDFSDVDRRTFLQEGAFGTVPVRTGQEESFKRQFTHTMEELYMERESRTFSQRGWVIDYNTRQEITDKNGEARIIFYDLKKRMAIDMDSRGSILSDAERPNIKFTDVIGAKKAKEELCYFVNYLKNPKQFLMNGGKAPKGVLLYGPPGTGKTMLAKAMAGESDVTFLSTSASEFKNKYVGESESNIRRIFAKAKRYAPAIIFIDEIDAIGKKRTGGELSSTTESMLNALLTEMDGFSSTDSSKPVFVLAATNFGVGAENDGISSLDEALIRRFDNKIYVDLPKESERKEYIMLMAEKKGMDQISENAAKSIAERTTGQSLAILQNVIDLALRNAVKESRKPSDDDLLTALEEYIYGEKKDHTP
ncbi:MAG: AAA family ATPase, partial [Lachnospiraceae bacterium]|nr:AAA family ATPase [Lachnospiraceae bacterium]